MKRKNNNAVLVILLAVSVLLSVVFAVVYSHNNDKGAGALKKTDSVKTQNQEEITQNQEEITPEIVPPEPPKENRLTFAAVGDNIIHQMVMDDAKSKAMDTEKEFSFLHMYESIKPIIQNADLAFVNQEGPIGGRELTYTGYPNFNSPEQAVYDLIETGFDIFNLANNHMLDRNARGYQNTAAFFSSLEGITHIGAYVNAEDYENIRIIERSGIKIALLSYTDMTNGYVLSSSSMVVPYAKDEDIDRQTKAARALADFVVVSVHWGVENSHTPNGTQKRQMQLMVNNNVDVIIGSHPHVLQPVEWQDRPDGNKTLVMYSLGNFLSNMEKMMHHVGAVATFDFVKDENGARIENACIIPTLCHFETSGGVNRDYKVMRLSEYNDSLLSVHARQNTGTEARRDLNYLYNIVKETVPGEFLTEEFYKNY